METYKLSQQQKSSEIEEIQIQFSSRASVMVMTGASCWSGRPLSGECKRPLRRPLVAARPLLECKGLVALLRVVVTILQ